MSRWGYIECALNTDGAAAEIVRLTRLLRHHERMNADLHETNQELRRRLGEMGP